jgi:hypothetical protein
MALRLELAFTALRTLTLALFDRDQLMTTRAHLKLSNFGLRDEREIRDQSALLPSGYCRRRLGS